METGRKIIDVTTLRGKNDARHDLILNSRYSKTVLKSQQTCNVRENRHKLEKLLAIAERERNCDLEKKRLNGLISVFDLLIADLIGIDGKEHTGCYLQFDDALEAFFDHFHDIKAPYLNTDKNKLLYALLHEKWGLCVYVVQHEDSSKRFLVLRPDEFDMEIFLDTICSKTKSQFAPRIALDSIFIHNLLATLDSEWDRVVARVLLGLDRSRQQLEAIGIDSRESSRNVEKVLSLILLD